MISPGIILDDSALAALRAGMAQPTDFVDRILYYGCFALVPGIAIAAAGIPRRYRSVAIVPEFSLNTALDLRRLLDSAESDDLVAAHVVYESLGLRWPIFTNSPKRYEPFGPQFLEVF